jgi:hypothetical protein
VNYLVDTSALVRIWRKQVDPVWRDIVGRGQVAVCEPVLAETLMISDANRYANMEEKLRETYVWAMVPDNIWDYVAAIRRELVPHSAHKGLSVADLVVAATAMRLKLTVLHEDADFETVARFVPLLQEKRISTAP